LGLGGGGGGDRSAAELLRFIPNQRLRDDYKKMRDRNIAKRIEEWCRNVSLSYFFFPFLGVAFMLCTNSHSQQHSPSLCTHNMMHSWASASR
jgi:hypothetical protein